MITLKKNAHRRVLGGHLWVFSNEIADPPVRELEQGSIHELRDSAGEFLAMVYANPLSLISARIFTRKKRAIDGAFLRERLRAALEARRRLFPDRNAYRVVFSESDFLPGLIVDRYGDYLALQTLTAGMELLQDLVIEVLVEILSPTGVYLRNDTPVRSLEGIPQYKRVAHGEVPDRVEIDSHGIRLLVDMLNGQKTGFFLDQEWNRYLMRSYVRPGWRVLDLFSYTAAWGLHALKAGADEVIAVDASAAALALAEGNARMNGLSDRLITLKDNALDFLKKSSDKWDMVILDPPAFIRTRSGIKEGCKGYIDLNRRAIGKLQPNGLLVSCSCSQHLDRTGFEDVLLAAARQAGRQLRILDTRGQGPDHPVLLSMPETRYLKVVVAQAI